MTLLILSFLAGVLTIAAPCVFTLLPIIVGGTVARTSNKDSRGRNIRPLIIAISLGLSVILFTLLLRATTALLDIPSEAWQILSGTIILILGLSFLWQNFWPKVLAGSGFHEFSNNILGKAYFKKGYVGDALTGAALGPVFSSCSPTYGFVVASVLPRSFAEGMLYLLVYTIGLVGTLLIVSYAGQSAAIKFGWLAKPNGLFRRLIGILFLIVGLSIILGFDRKFEAGILDAGFLDPILKFENNLR